MGYHIDLLDDLVNGNVTDDLIKIKENFLELNDSRIVEHNLNILSPSNGYYVRWENGLQVCFYESELIAFDFNNNGLYAGSKIWRYPASFISPPKINVTGAVNSGSGGIVGGQYKLPTITFGYLWGANPQSGTDGYLYAIAIGRWK